MTRNLVMSLFSVGLITLLAVGCGPRLTEERLEKARENQRQLEETRKAEEAAAPAASPAEEAAAPAEAAADPNTVKVRFECSCGDFVVEVYKDWAPLGAARFLELVEKGIYNEAYFFRVVPGFVVQFGIPGDPKLAAEWRTKTIKDDPVKETNAKGTLTFATSGPNSRTSQLFVNLVDNARLDGMGFAPFAKVVEGMDVVERINPKHRERPNQGNIQTMGNAYLKKLFPDLDYIKKAEVVK